MDKPETGREYAARIKERDDAADHAWRAGDSESPIVGRSLLEKLLIVSNEQTKKAEQECGRLKIINDALLAALETAEETLGVNLVWINDLADLRIRQKDTETLARLAKLEQGWKALVAAIALAKGDK